MDEVEKKKIQVKLKKKYKSNKRWILFWAIAFALLAIVIAIPVITQTRTDTDAGERVTEIRALTCRTAGQLYPYFTYDNSTKKDLKIIVTFADDDVRSLSLQQTLYYPDEEMKVKSEAENHASVNKQFGTDSMQADALGATYAITSDGVRFGLYITSDQLNSKSAKYFLIDEATKHDYNNIRQALVAQGLECEDK